MSASRRPSTTRALAPLVAALALLTGLLAVTQPASAAGPTAGAAGASAASPAPTAYVRPVPEVPVQACSKYAAPDGDDANPGTKASPVKNIGALTQILAPGQTGCIRDGSTITMDGSSWGNSWIYGGSAGQPKIIRPETPGSRAELVTLTQFYVGGNQSDLILQDLDLAKTGTVAGSAVRIDGDRVTLDGVDLTYPENICLDVGGDARSGEWHLTVEDFALIDSRIHDCGVTHLNDPADPGGAHGVYLQLTRDGAADADGWGAIIYNSLFDHNKDRGVQLYPDADDVLVDRVVMYGNGSNLNIGSESGYAGDPDAARSDRARVRGSIIANSRLDAYSGNNPNSTATADVLGNFAHGVGAGADNQVVASCLYNQTRNDHLFEVTDNDFSALKLVDVTLNQPATFVDAAARDFRLAPGSACQGMGLADPARLPGGKPDVVDPSGGMSLVAAATDNYKTWKDGVNRPNVGTEARTSLLFEGLRVGSTTYVVPTAQRGELGSPNGAPEPLVNGIPLATAPDQPVSAYLSFTQPGNAGVDTAYYRIFSGGSFGIYSVVNRQTFAQTPLDLTLSLRNAAGATLATLPASYRHDAQIAALPEQYLEYGGPAGRWHTGAGTTAPTPLNWPYDVAVSMTPGGTHQNGVTVPASTATPVHLTPVDVAGLAVPRYTDWDGNPLQLKVYKGNTLLGETTGTGTTRAFTVTEPVGAYAYRAEGLCDGYCRVDYEKVPLVRGFSVDAVNGRAPSTPGTPAATAGDGRATVSWTAPADLGDGTGFGYLVTAQRVGDAAASTHTCSTTTLSCTVTGLYNLPSGAEPYRFTVVARNSVGSSSASAPSNPVWPRVAQVASYRPDVVVLGDAGAVGAGVVNANGQDQVLDITLPAGTTRVISLQVRNAGNVTDTYGLAEGRGGQFAALSHSWARDGVDVSQDLSPAVGWHVVRDVAAGDQRTLGLTLGAPASTPVGTSATYALHAYHSPASAGIKDVAIVRVTVTQGADTGGGGGGGTDDGGSTQTPEVRFSRVRYAGVLAVGKRLTARVAISSPGSGVRLSYRWLRGKSRIAGATGRTYRLTRADRGKRITLRVTARAPGHTTATRSHRRTARVRVAS